MKELTENDNQETSTHSEYKIPGKNRREEYHITFPACIQDWFPDYASYVILERLYLI